MDIFEAMKKRHSVRRYLDKKIEDSIANELLAYIEECNQKAECIFSYV